MEKACVSELSQEDSNFIASQDERINEPNLDIDKFPALGEKKDSGKIYVEARVRDDFTGDVEKINHEILRVFSLDHIQCLSLILWQEMLESDAFKNLFPEDLLSLRAVEYVGKEFSSTHFPLSSVVLEIHVFRMSTYSDHLEDDETLLQAEIIQLPSSRFEGVWEKLVFDTDIRGNLIRLMTNMLKFSRALATSNLHSRTNRLILLSGSPGTGKTTLCQALAQKLSIRLNLTYSSTSLIQINAASLLSKFFSESAKHILTIFTAIFNHCTCSPDSFTVVLIDEVESLASSRHTASSRGEVQDTIRATNALLTGFDMVKSQPNLIILCTSNMIHTLDLAFLDRCGHRIAVEPPSCAARYQILRDGIQELITAGIVKSNRCSGDNEQCNTPVVPSYRDANLALLSEPTKPGSVLMDICLDIDRLMEQHQPEIEVSRCSARFLGQLPEVALADRMISDFCSLDEALNHMKSFVLDYFKHKSVPDGSRLGFYVNENANVNLSPGLKRRRIDKGASLEKVTWL